MTISNRIELGLLMLCIAVCGPAAAAPHSSTYFPGQLLVKFKADAPAAALKANRQISGARIKADMPKLGWKLVQLPEGTDVAAALAEWRNRPDVAYVEPNYRIHLFATPNDPRYPGMWGLTKIGAPEAWDTTTGSSSLVVAVMDTGLDYNHPDLAANVWTNPGEVPNNGYDDDHDGYIDDVHGINLFNTAGDVLDDDGHGTHVAGTIGAVGNNGLGSVGINWQVKLLSLKIFTADDSAGTAGAVEGYEYLIALKKRGVNIRVVNNSWGGPVPSQALSEAMRAAEALGILSVCAAGNSHHNADDQPEFPANLDVESLISVAASTRDDDLASFSNYGEWTVDIAAPGESILSTYKGSGHYQVLSGTSMACPHVSGAAALLLARNGSLTPSNVKALLMDTADKLPQWQGKVAAQGRLNVARALAKSISGPIPILAPDTNDLDLPYPRITAISRNAQGRYGSDASFFPSISTNGQFVAYLSLATNLTSGASSTNTQVYVYDRSARTTVLVSHSNSGATANGDCADVKISANGRFIVFSSSATNLIANDNNGVSDVFLFDRTTSQVELISKSASSSAPGNGASEYTGISDDGRYVVFASDASDLIASDVNGYRDIFVRDRQTAATTRVSVSSSSVAGDYTSDLPSISGDGRYVAFLSGADNLVTTTYFPAYQLYLRDRTGAKTILVSKSSGGLMGRGHSGFSALSDDGRYLAFESSATNLVSGDTNMVQDMFLYDRVNATTKRISLSNSGAQADDDSWLPCVSADGRHVSFMSFASTLSSQDDNYACDIFDYDRLTGKLSRLSYSHAGRAGADDSYAPACSYDGRFVAFDSRAWNLIPSGGNGARCVFVMDRGTATPDLMIEANGGTNYQGQGLHGTNIVQRRELSATNGVASFSIRLVNNGPADEVFSIRSGPAPVGWSGQYFRGTTNITSAVTGSGWLVSLDPGSNVVVRLDAASADASAGESWAEFYVVASGTTPGAALDAVRAVATRVPSPPALQVVSRAADGRIGNSSSGQATTSSDGRYVAFTSSASDLTSADYNLQEDVFVRDRQGGSVECLSKPDSETGNGRSYNSQISRDGRYVVFQSSATNLVSGDTNDREDIFLFDRQTKTTSRMSYGSGGVQSLRDSAYPAMSGDARYIAFESLASNFVSNDQNGTWDIFLRDRTAGTIQCLSLAGAATANDESHSPVVSNDGSLVAFTSLASNLSAGDTNETYDVFLWVRGVGLKLISRTASGIAGNDLSSYPSISDDNRYIVFSSRATNLAVASFSTNSITFIYDRETDQLSQLNPPWVQGRQRHGYFGAQIAPNGQSMTLLADVSTVAGGTNYTTGVFLYNRTTESLTELSRMRSGVAGNNQSDSAAMSADGRYVAILSRASNLLGETGPAVDQVMLFDVAAFQPDGWIRRDNTTANRGQDTFSPAIQWVEQTAALNFTNNFFLTVYNSGNFSDYFIFKGATGITGGIKARYFLQPAGTEITGSATNAGWKSDLLAPGASREIRVQIIASNTNLFNQDLVFSSTSVTDPTKVDLVRVRLLRDDDNDGLPNTWEQQFFGNTTSALPAADSDNDGLSNYAEYVAGTNPTNADSSLRITGIGVDSGPTLRITWPGATNRIYSLERANSTPSGFSTIGELYGTSPETTFFDPMATNTTPMFYRVRAEIP